MTGPERDPLAANEERLGAVRAYWLDKGSVEIEVDYNTERAEHDIAWLLDALTQARGDAQAAEEMTHTNHEYDLEKLLWRLLVANQQYILALANNEHVLAAVWLSRLKVFQKLWLESPNWYMQHPDWLRSDGDIEGDITGKPFDAAQSEDGA